jgi:hypothetical protein
MTDFDRYASFKANGKIGIVPFITINKKNTDRYIVYDKRKIRLDKLSYEYYESPDYAWLIMQANPEYGSIESLIPNGVTLRIPYPLQETLNSYINGIKNYRELY